MHIFAFPSGPKVQPSLTRSDLLDMTVTMTILVLDYVNPLVILGHTYTQVQIYGW